MNLKIKIKLKLLKIRAISGETLIEVLAAMTILSILLPSLFYIPSGILKSIISLKRNDIFYYGAQFWFSRLPDPKNINITKLKSMPSQTPDGSVKFNLLECTPEANGSFKIILEVQAVKYKNKYKNTLLITRYI